MTSPVSVLLRYPGAVPRDMAMARDHSVRRRVNVAWGLLYLNTMTFVGGIGVLPLPSRVGKGIAQAALPLALLVLLTVNPRLKVRPNAFLCIVSLLVVDAGFTSIQVHQLGTLFRTVRLAEFVCALWLLTPWWGRSDMLLFKCHLRWTYIALGSVLLGMVVSPGHAFAFDGRLEGVIWPMLPTQVAQYAAVAAGLTIVLWFARQLSGQAALPGVIFAVALLILTHTRTALAALSAGILVAGLNLFTSNARVRKAFTAGGVAVSVAAVTAAGFITTWLARGEGTQGLTTMTGRTNFWTLVLNYPRDRFQEIFGFGLSNASVNGLPIDSNWMASYMQEGLYGVAICAIILAFLLIVTLLSSRGMARALALFLVTYVLVASFAEDAFTDVSTYMLHLTVAASLLAVTLRPGELTG